VLSVIDHPLFPADSHMAFERLVHRNIQRLQLLRKSSRYDCHFAVVTKSFFRFFGQMAFGRSKEQNRFFHLSSIFSLKLNFIIPFLD
jgi:hypothetical protein